MELRTMLPSDLPAGLRLCRACGWNQLDEDWLQFLHAEGAGARVAERQQHAVGTVAWLRYGAAFSWIAMMLVDPDARHAGIGSRLFECALEELRNEPCIRLDATPAGEPLYRRYGFIDEFGLLRTKTIVTPNQFEPVHHHVEPIQPGDLPEVLSRDRIVFGADRSELLTSFFRRAPHLAHLARHSGALLGYCFGRPGHLYSQLGPIVAGDTEIARALIAKSLSPQTGIRIAIDVPKHATELIHWMESASFIVERPFLRMRRGTLSSPGQPDQVYAIAGPEFG
jgi:GNAT superfamily N-acetyltransferase